MLCSQRSSKLLATVTGEVSKTDRLYFCADRALDFLFIDYKPPHPLNVLITPIILSKYQRLFAFILRMMRGKFIRPMLSLS
jgi:hypothetical protein